MLLAVMFFFGFFLQGFLVNGAQSVVLKACQKLRRLSSYVMFLHFCFALGATVAPLWAGLLVAQGSLNVFNSSWPGDSSTLLDSSGSMNTTHFTSLSNLALNSSSSVNIPYYEEDAGPESSALFAWAYWLCAPFFLTALVAFLYHSIKHELHIHCRTQKYEIIMNTNPEPRQETKEQLKVYFLTTEPLQYKIVFFALISLLAYFCVAIEACITNYLFTYAVQEAHFAKDRAANLNSAFWGVFASFRLLAVFLSFLKIPSATLVMFNLIGGLLVSLLMALLSDNPIVVWCGAVLLGVCTSSTFPSIVAWLAQQTEVSGKKSALLLCPSTLADMTVPVTIAVLMTRVSPSSFMYFITAGFALALLCSVALFYFTWARKRCYSKGHPTCNVVPVESASPSPSISFDHLEDDQCSDESSSHTHLLGKKHTEKAVLIRLPTIDL